MKNKQIGHSNWNKMEKYTMYLLLLATCIIKYIHKYIIWKITHQTHNTEKNNKLEHTIRNELITWYILKI